MKKILITISNGSIARNLLRASLLDLLLQNGDVKIFLLVPADRAALYTEEFGVPRVEIVGLPEKLLPTFFDRFLMYACRNCFRTETLLSLQRTRLLVDRNYFAFFLKRLLIYAFGRSHIAHTFIRMLALYRKPAGAMKGLMERIKPDLLFATDVQDEMDLHAMAQARVMGVKTIGMVRSWDNLTNNFVQMAPETILVWNPYIRKRAITLQHIPEKSICIVGMPQYDYFFRKEFLVPREQFLASLGFPQESKLILFAAIGHFFAPYEWDIPQILNDAIERGDLPCECVVVMRPHPASGIPAGMEPKGLHVFKDQPVHYVGGSVSSRNAEITKRDIDHFGNLLYHADVVVTGASTISIDAALFDRPIINYAFDGWHAVPYYQSVRSAYKYSHYKALLRSGGMRLVNSEEEMIAWIQKYLRDPTIDHAGREKIIDEFIGPRDSKSVERISALILELLE